MASGALRYHHVSEATVVDECPNCNVATALRLDDARIVWPYVTTETTPLDQAYALQHVFACTYCGRTTVVQFLFGAADDERYRGPDEARIVVPAVGPRELPAAAPAAARSYFREGSVCEEAGALRAAAGMYRAAVEEIVRDQGATTGDLKAKINELAAKGLDADLVEAMHEARLLAGWSLHRGPRFSKDEVADVALLIAEAVEVLYVAPAQKEAMRKARAARRTAAGKKPTT